MYHQSSSINIIIPVNYIETKTPCETALWYCILLYSIWYMLYIVAFVLSTRISVHGHGGRFISGILLCLWMRQPSCGGAVRYTFIWQHRLSCAPLLGAQSHRRRHSVAALCCNIITYICKIYAARDAPKRQGNMHMCNAIDVVFRKLVQIYSGRLRVLNEIRCWIKW